MSSKYNNDSEIVIEAKREVLFSKINSVVDNYFVYVDGGLSQVVQSYDEAVAFASKMPGKNYVQDNKKNIIWDNHFKYTVISSNIDYKDGIHFEDLVGAIKYAKDLGVSEVVLKEDTEKVVWSGEYSAEHIIKNTPHIEQLPELARGCEVTSLAMLLKSVGVAADKMVLAEQIKKDPTPYKKTKGITYFGNPHYGFVGDIYSLKNEGLGVYNEPIFDLAQKYTERVVNLTGCEFEDVLYFVSRDIPVWIITNSRYAILPESEFKTWTTPSGEIKITYREHSVIIVGYDDKYIYINDPLRAEPQSRVEKQSFIEAYNQMGKQAISCLSEN